MDILILFKGKYGEKHGDLSNNHRNSTPKWGILIHQQPAEQVKQQSLNTFTNI